MTAQKRYPKEVRERAIRLVVDGANEYGSQWAAICEVGCKKWSPTDRKITDSEDRNGTHTKRDIHTRISARSRQAG